MSKFDLTTEVTERTERIKNANEITEIVIGCAIEVHRTLGPGLLESVDQLAPIHEAQLLSYLKLSDLKVGLLINFNERVLTHSVRRKVLGPPDEISL